MVCASPQLAQRIIQAEETAIRRAGRFKEPPDASVIHVEHAAVGGLRELNPVQTSGALDSGTSTQTKRVGNVLG